MIIVTVVAPVTGHICTVVAGTPHHSRILFVIIIGDVVVVDVDAPIDIIQIGRGRSLVYASLLGQPTADDGCQIVRWT
jgi:hypothetical protein